MGTHLNCIDNICQNKEVDKTYTGCNLKTTVLLDYVLIGIYAVNRSNMVITTTSQRDGWPQRLGSASDWRSGCRCFDPWVRQHSFVEFDRGLFSPFR